MKRVLQKKEHRLEGAALIVKPYEESIKKDNHSLMVRRCIALKINVHVTLNKACFTLVVWGL